MKYNVTAIIVTYNRKELLSECLEAIGKQTYKPAVTYVVDNASTDGTDGWIRANGYDTFKDGIEYRYIRMPENVGGSGGFYIGLKMAFEAKDQFDAFWVMDDDGIPEVCQLQRLQEHLGERDYLSPLVVAKEDQGRLSFGGSPKIQDFLALKGVSDGLVDNTAFPFNGVLFSRKLVELVEYPIKDMFIWGDEVNYNLRCVAHGFIPAVVVNAIHVHPADRQMPQLIVGNRKVTVPPQDWKLYCYVRNKMYNLRTLATVRHFVGDTGRMLFRYTVYFTIYAFNWRRLGIVYRAMWDGYRKDLSRLSNYR